jgi:antitoxin (DNA-binding transcriptional repressor) of toxin-antitoxin stability system
MKVIDLEEAKTNLAQYAQECQSSPVVVTFDGKPLFEMLPIRAEDPDFLDQLLANNQAFRNLAEERRRECDTGRMSSLEEVRQRLNKLCKD